MGLHFDRFARGIRGSLLTALLALAACARARNGTALGDDRPAASLSTSPAPSATPTSTPAILASLPVTPELVVYATAPRTLRGFLARPPGEGPFPAVVFNHGSEPRPGSMQGQITFYTAHGFVVFVPHRRGHGQSEGAYLMLDITGASDELRPAVFVQKLMEQVDDVAAAVEYVKRQPFVDPAKIVIAGCSFGGIESLLAAERDLGIRAAVDFAGAAMAWGQSDSVLLRDRMIDAARHARVPVFFLQAENDFDIRPTQVLSAEMQKAGLPYRAKIFPPNGATHQEGHAFCRGGEAPPWGPDVLDFLTEAMRRVSDRPPPVGR